ncbi:hypothetical protein KFZ56_01760 [Virgibacillus sp. NKC19-3]|uniref:hypothetical protein n=1 Tax=Virgibacillus saliphilus TaxID=2831674 RepID=UPI001C9A44A3|nr:hypothetical protein [Virgibacillus sp. NKC19-3]MBY7141834.1 hypothetical protein [Virgibacillus sp. NKC19-3]
MKTERGVNYDSSVTPTRQFIVGDFVKVEVEHDHDSDEHEWAVIISCPLLGNEWNHTVNRQRMKI